MRESSCVLLRAAARSQGEDENQPPNASRASRDVAMPPQGEAEAEGPESGEQAAVTACGHVYHLECWQSYVAYAGSAGLKCPNCRYGLALRHATPLSPPPLLPAPETHQAEGAAVTSEAKPTSHAQLTELPAPTVDDPHPHPQPDPSPDRAAGSGDGRRDL